MKFLILIFILLKLVTYNESAKIMAIFPFPSKSQHILGSALLKELAARGHEVTMVSPFPLKNPPENYYDVDLKLDSSKKEDDMKQMANQRPLSLYNRLEMTLNAVKLMSHGVLESENLQAFLITKPKFDLVIHMLFMNEALLGIPHAVNASAIFFSIAGGSPFTHYHTNIPNPYSYVPNPFLPLTDDMSFFERVMNTVTNLAMNLVIHYVDLPYQQSILSEFFPNSPPLQELINNVDLTLVNSHIATESARPYIPNVIQIGGFHLQEKQNLTSDLKRYLDESKNGVVFFSLGSNVKSADLPKEKLDIMLNAFKNIDYNILWKFETELSNLPKNVRIGKWLPQRAILEHPNVKAFITHGGMGSTVEAIYHGVPMICIPFFGDQEKNSRDSVRNGYAIRLDVKNLTEIGLVAAINDIIRNPKYSNSVMLKSDIYKNQPINPMGKAVYWVEHVIKHKGAKHLKTRGAEIPFYQYMLLDVFSFILLCSCLSLLMMVGLVYGSCKIFKKIFKKKCCNKNAQTDNEKKTK